jgi:hypothetical protein
MAVQPRSLAMYRAEQVIGLSGSIRLEDADGRRTIHNESELELRDAVLVDDPAGRTPGDRPLGTIAAGGVVELGGGPAGEVPTPGAGFDGPEPGPFLEALRRAREVRPENQGELRLVAWIPTPVGGQTFEPALDRHRGMTAVLVHLRHGNPPSPDGPRYNLLATGAGPPAEAEAAPTAAAPDPLTRAMALEQAARAARRQGASAPRMKPRGR